MEAEKIGNILDGDKFLPTGYEFNHNLDTRRYSSGSRNGDLRVLGEGDDWSRLCG